MLLKPLPCCKFFIGGLTLLIALSAVRTAQSEQQPPAGAAVEGVSLLPSILKTWSCAGDGEVFTQFFELELTLRNHTKTEVVIPKIHNSISAIRLADNEQKLKADQYDIEIIPETMWAGDSAVIKVQDFVTVLPSVDRRLPITPQVVIPASMPKTIVPGVAKSGENWMVVRLKLWSAERATAARWQQKFTGHLLTTPIQSEPIRITVPSQPNFDHCPKFELP